MQSGLLTSSSFGKFYPKQGQKAHIVQLAISSPLLEAQFSITGERLYLLDGSGNLTCLSLLDSSISTFNSIKLNHFSIESNNAYSVYAVSKQSELWHISFESKKKTKIFNLSMCRVISFDKNHFTNLFLIVEFQIAMIFDMNSNSNKIKSLKANNGEVFTAGRFIGKNRFLALAVKNKQLRLVEILGMKTQDQLTLPVEIKGIKLESTIDGEKIAVFGESGVLIIVIIKRDRIVSYEVLQLPVKAILALKFTSDNDVVLLAGNRVLYAINKNNELVQLYNETEKTPFNNFDISLNSQSIVLTAGKKVHFLSYPRGIRLELENTYGTELKSSVNPLAQEQGSRQIQYDEEEQEEKQEDDQLLSSEIATPPDLPKFASINPQKVELIPEAQDLKASKRQQLQLTTIYQYLHQFQAAKNIVHLHRQAVLHFLHAILNILKDPRQTAIATYHIFSNLGASINDGSLQNLITLLAPRVYEKIQKANGKFDNFVIENLLNLFGNFTYNKDNEITKAILQNCHRQSFISSFIISMFLQLRANSPSWPSPHLQQLNLSQVLEETQTLMSNPRQTYNVHEQHQQEEDNLEILMKRQQQIRQELVNIRRNYS